MIRDTKQLMTDAYGAGFDAGRQAGVLEGSTTKARSISRKTKGRAKAVNTGHPAASPAPPEGGTTQVQQPQRKARKSPKRARSSVQQQGTST